MFRYGLVPHSTPWSLALNVFRICSPPWISVNKRFVGKLSFFLLLIYSFLFLVLKKHMCLISIFASRFSF